MPESKHTPGPWHADPLGNGTRVFSWEGPDDYLIAELGDQGNETAANAALIAAAPDMYEALRALVSAFESREADPMWQLRKSTIEAWDDAIDAVAKVQGR